MENDRIRLCNNIRAINNLALQISLGWHWRHNCSRAVTNHFRLLPLLLYQSGFEVDIIYKAYCPPLITSFAIVVWKGTLICAWQPTYVNRHANKKSSFLYPISWDLGIYDKNIHSFIFIANNTSSILRKSSYILKWKKESNFTFTWKEYILRVFK